MQLSLFSRDDLQIVVQLASRSEKQSPGHNWSLAVTPGAWSPDHYEVQMVDQLYSLKVASMPLSLFTRSMTLPKEAVQSFMANITTPQESINTAILMHGNMWTWETCVKLECWKHWIQSKTHSKLSFSKGLKWWGQSISQWRISTPGSNAL